MGIQVKRNVAVMPRKREKGEYKHELIGARLREWREGVGLSGPQLATRVGYSWSGYKKIERGERAPSPELLQKLHDAFGISPDSFLIPNGHSTAHRALEGWALLLQALTLNQRRALRLVGEAMIAEGTEFPEEMTQVEARRVARAIRAFLGPSPEAESPPRKPQG